MQVEHDERKREYDTLQLQLESSMSRLEVEVKQYQEEIMGKLNCLKLKHSAFLGFKKFVHKMEILMVLCLKQNVQLSSKTYKLTIV